MRIALIAHDSRKELMAQFCTAYVRILSENDLVATGVTGKIVHDATGLPVRTLYPGGRGGAEQIAAMIGCGEVDMLLFFRDPVGAKPGKPQPIPHETPFLKHEFRDRRKWGTPWAAIYGFRAS